MKKILVFLFAVLALGGCGSGDIENMLVDEPRLETFRGVVESQDDFDEYSGTHLLRMEDEVLPLRSLSLNLSNKKYLGANVEVMGVYVEDEAVFEVTGISVKRAVEESDSVGMVEFVSENLGLKINYYSDWELDENGNLLTFRAPSLDGSFADQIEISMSPYDFVSELEDPENDLADPLE
ncbi:membrane lipoprotein lipid attachment site-containing protein, partial [Patescibacteria group bacterium]|nr:membrane lipoprotein lipid attachment site-containing protein [Patescibacteria group bacterium]